MDIYQLQTEDYRRSALWFLLYDSDYKLSDTMLHQCFIANGKPLSFDRMQTVAQWLCEQGLTTASTINSVGYLALSNRGLEVAQGIVSAIGVRDLRPSEFADVKAIRRY